MKKLLLNSSKNVNKIDAQEVLSCSNEREWMFNINNTNGGRSMKRMSIKALLLTLCFAAPVMATGDYRLVPEHLVPQLPGADVEPVVEFVDRDRQGPIVDFTNIDNYLKDEHYEVRTDLTQLRDLSL